MSDINQPCSSVSTVIASQAKFSNRQKLIGIGLTFIITTMMFAVTGCSTTQELKPTATVIVGGHKSI